MPPLLLPNVATQRINFTLQGGHKQLIFWPHSTLQPHPSLYSSLIDSKFVFVFRSLDCFVLLLFVYLIIETIGDGSNFGTACFQKNLQYTSDKWFFTRPYLSAIMRSYYRKWTKVRKWRGEERNLWIKQNLFTPHHRKLVPIKWQKSSIFGATPGATLQSSNKNGQTILWAPSIKVRQRRFHLNSFD